MKKYLAIALSFFFATSAYAAIELGNGVSLSGSMEINYMFRLNNAQGGEYTDPDANNNNTRYPQTGVGQALEVATVININGNHETDIGFVIWKLAQKVATDYRYDSFGRRESWGGLKTKYGTVKFGNQFSNIYLAVDYPYGSKGVGNLFADYGAHYISYTRAISYYTPSIAGFVVATQYNIHTTINNANTNATKDNPANHAIEAFAAEVLATYNNAGFRADLGYGLGQNGSPSISAGINNRNNSFLAANQFGGQLTGYGTPIFAYSGDNTVAKTRQNSVLFIGAMYTFDSGFFARAGYKMNTWEETNATIPTLGSGTDNVKVTDNQFVTHVGYIAGKNAFALGYQLITAPEVKYLGNTTKYADATINQFAFQYERTIAPNIIAFMQTRYKMFKSEKGKYASFDGAAGNEKDSGRILFGIWAGV